MKFMFLFSKPYRHQKTKQQKMSFIESLISFSGFNKFMYVLLFKILGIANGQKIIRPNENFKSPNINHTVQNIDKINDFIYYIVKF